MQLYLGNVKYKLLTMSVVIKPHWMRKVPILPYHN